MSSGSCLACPLPRLGSADSSAPIRIVCKHPFSSSSLEPPCSYTQPTSCSHSLACAWYLGLLLPLFISCPSALRLSG